MEEWLGQRIIGQQHILKATAENIRRNLAGFSGRQPIGSFLFLGPTGVGKTETVKALAEFLFGTPDAMVRFDMSEFLESHSVSRLIGSPPGYVGYSDGGQLTDQIRKRPYQIVLFDEIEKSHRDVWNLLLQVLDDGLLTDGKGRTVDFSNTVIIMTSNLGAQALNMTDGVLVSLQKTVLIPNHSLNNPWMRPKEHFLPNFGIESVHGSFSTHLTKPMSHRSLVCCSMDAQSCFKRKAHSFHSDGCGHQPSHRLRWVRSKTRRTTHAPCHRPGV